MKCNGQISGAEENLVPSLTWWKFGSGSTLQAAGFLCCGQCLRDERLGTTRTASVADTPSSDTDIIVGGHGAEMREVRKVSTFQEVARIDRLSLLVAPRAKCLTCLRFSADGPPRTSRLLSCRRSVGWPPVPGLTTKRPRM